MNDYQKRDRRIALQTLLVALFLSMLVAPISWEPWYNIFACIGMLACTLALGGGLQE